MSPLRRQKRPQEGDLRVRARRARLAARERQQYQLERAEAQPDAEQPSAASTGRVRRRRRRALRPGLAGLRRASTTGARATARQAQPSLRRIVASLGSALAWVAAALLRLAAVLEAALAKLVAAFIELGRRAFGLAQRHAPPDRVLVAVTGAAAGCLIVSQFVAYRGVEVGYPQYAEVSSVVQPQQTDRIAAGAAHAYVLVPLAAIAFGIAVLALISGRWRLGRLVSLIGLAGIAIGLAIDLPKGLDAGTAGAAFAGAKATMTEGFYAQLAASAGLILCGIGLERELKQRAGASEPRPRRRTSRRRAPRAPSVARGGA
jgi:hypothetical protein